MQSYKYSKVFKPKSLKSKQKGKQQKPGKDIISFSDVKVLINAKNTLESLPSSQEYELQHQIDYARKIGEVVPLFQKIRLEQIEYVVSETTLKKLILQLTRQVQFKQIVITLLKLVLKGIKCYQKLVEGELYDVLAFMIQIDDLAQRNYQILPDSSTKHLKKAVISISIFQLIKNVRKWYGCSLSGKVISQKYGGLIQMMHN